MFDARSCVPRSRVLAGVYDLAKDACYRVSIFSVLMYQVTAVLFMYECDAVYEYL